MLLFAALNVAGQTLPNTLTPESAVATAQAENRDLIAARFAIRQAEGRLKQAGLWPNPEIDFSQETDRTFASEGEYSFSTGFRQRFPITGRLSKAKAVARVDVAQALAEVRNQERLLSGEVLDLSRALLVGQEKLAANAEIQSIFQKLIDVSDKRLKVAEVSEADVNLARLEAQKVIFVQAALLNEQEIAATALNRLLGRDPKSPVQISSPARAEFDIDFITQASGEALARRPDRQLAALGIDRAGAEIKLARAEKWEDWTVGFGYTRARSVFSEPTRLDDTDNLIGVSLSIPLPLWNRNQGRISEAVASRGRAEAELKALELSIITEVQTAENQMHRTSSILREYQEQTIKLAEANVALLQKGYADGLVSISAVIQGQQQLIDLRRASLDALGQFIRAKTAWETATAINIPIRQGLK